MGLDGGNNERVRNETGKPIYSTHSCICSANFSPVHTGSSCLVTIIVVLTVFPGWLPWATVLSTNSLLDLTAGFL